MKDESGVLISGRHAQVTKPDELTSPPQLVPPEITRK